MFLLGTVSGRYFILRTDDEYINQHQRCLRPDVSKVGEYSISLTDIFCVTLKYWAKTIILRDKLGLKI